MNSGKTRFQGSSKPKFFPAWARCACDSNVSKVAVLCAHQGLAGCSAGHTHGMGGPGGAVPPPGEEWGSCPSAQPWRIPPPEIALYSDFSFLLQVLLLLSLKSRSSKPSCCGGRWDLGGIYSFKAKMCVQLMISFVWKHYSVAGAEMLSCLCQTSLIKLSTESAKN